MTTHPDAHSRVAVVTGASSGIGAATARTLAAQGFHVVVLARRGEAVQRLAEQIGGTAVVADVTDDAAVRALAEGLTRVDVLVNNAGDGMLLVSEKFNRKPPPFWTVRPETWQQIVETNVNGGFLMAREAAPHMLAAGWGRIVNVTTSIQTMQRRGYAPYGPTKAALEAASSCWAEDLEGSGVTCNVLIPGGAADTNLLPGNPGDPGRSGADGMLVDPKVMRAPVLWLASRASDGWNGKRFIARLWDDALAPEAAAEKCSGLAGVGARLP